MTSRNEKESFRLYIWPFTLVVVAVLIIASASPVNAAGKGEPGPIYPVEITIHNRIADLKMLTEMGIDIDAVFYNRVRAYVIAEEEEKLKLLGYSVTPIPDEAKIAAEREAASAAPGAKPPQPPSYHTYATLTEELHQIAQDHPGITRLYSIGKSVQNRDLWMMKITKNPDLEEDEPEVRYIAAMHGDEVVGKENCINFINLLTDNYGTDPRITNIVDTMEVWVLPSMNPDGTEMHMRYNANYVDLNRDFPDQFEDPVDSTEGRQPETAAVMNWGYAHSTLLSANFHGGAVVANYPYDGTASHASVYNPTDDDPFFVSISRTYADNNPSMVTSNSDPAFNNGICNGADWYVIYGGLQDWNYVWHGGHEITVEVTQNKWPPADELPAHWNDNKESMLAYIERAHEGIRGIVTDSQTGIPLAATVRVQGVDHDVYADPDVGDYHRLLSPGKYSLEFSATGYISKIVNDIQVVEGGPATRCGVALEPLDVDLQHIGNRVLDTGEGNGNGFLDPGESADLAVTLRNLGMTATSVSGELEPTGWHATVTRTDASYPDLAPGESGESLSPHYGISLSPDVSDGHKVGFAVRWQSTEGRGTTEPFFIPGGTPACTTIASSDIPKAIQDRQTATSLIDFGPDREISEVNVYVDVTHTYISDLTVMLLSPDGTPVVLHDRSGGSSDNIVGWYDSELSSFEPLSRMNGEHSTGTWMLKVNDGVPYNTGTLNGWSIEICGRPFETSTPEMRFSRIWKEPGKTVLTWWPYPDLTSYKVYRSTTLVPRDQFIDVTSEDSDPTDTRFDDSSTASSVYWLVTGVGPNGEGPR
ncbi:MAG: M14 family zinc carboxypeptidase [Acidobacteriota bacterium]